MIASIVAMFIVFTRLFRHLLNWNGLRIIQITAMINLKTKFEGSLNEGLPGESLFPSKIALCSHVPTFSECFRTVIFRILFPCSQKLANVPLFPSIFCQCSLVPQNPWETLLNRPCAKHKEEQRDHEEFVSDRESCWQANSHGNLYPWLKKKMLIYSIIKNGEKMYNYYRRN